MGRSRPAVVAQRKMRMAPVCNAEGFKTGVRRNPNLGKLQAGYLFPEVRHLPRVKLSGVEASLELPRNRGAQVDDAPLARVY